MIFKKELNGWHGAGLACVIFGVGIIILARTDALTPTPEAAAAAKAEQLRAAQKGVVIGTTAKGNEKVERFYDEEAGNYVYIAEDNKSIAISVVPATGRVEKTK